jgi:Cu(I)/Ag(I) efflux system membrane fusion protein
MCKERIEKAAREIKSVVSASWDMETKQLHLVCHPSTASLQDVAQAVARAGHDTDAFKAGEAVYQALPDCCKYR